MTKFALLGRAAGVSTLLALAAFPAHASESDRIRQTIVAAQAKIDAGDKIGASNIAPGIQSQAKAELANAQDLFSHHKKDEAMRAAQHAADLADQAVMAANHRQVGAERDARKDAETAAAVNGARANAATQAATDSAAQAASANQAAAAAAAEASALRNAPPPPPPAPVTTTVTTDTTKVVEPGTTSVTTHVVPAHRVTRVHHHPGRVVAAKTKTTVTTDQPQ